jgi:uracil-DNA glycosylase family 4
VADDDRRALLDDLRQLIELDRGLGVEFLARPAAGVAPPAATAPAPAPAAAPAERPRPATALVSYATLPPARPTSPSQPSSALAPMTQPPPPVSAPTGMAAADIAAIAAEVAQCRACGLCATRTNTVPGEGNPATELVFVGEGPGADEDAQGRPFVGRAGELLTAMIVAMGFPRDQVFICNVVKCRPPGNRLPAPDEIAACQGFLHRQLLAIRPKVICTLGNTPLRALMGDDKLGITKLRGQRLDWRGIPLIPTFHPAYLLRNPPAKKPCWEDLKVVLGVLGRTPPARKAD